MGSRRQGRQRDQHQVEIRRREQQGTVDVVQQQFRRFQSSGGGGSSSGGGGGSSSGGGEGLSQYIQAYRLNFFTDGKPPGGMVQRAKDNNWSVAYFIQQVRRNDKNYWKSDEAKTLLPKFSRTMKVLFPGLSDKDRTGELMKSPFYKGVAMWYLKNGVGLQGQRRGTALQPDHQHEAVEARPTPTGSSTRGTATSASLRRPTRCSTRQHLDTHEGQPSRSTASELPEDYYRTFFKSRYASSDRHRRAAGRTSRRWRREGRVRLVPGQADGPEQETKQTIFGGEQADRPQEPPGACLQRARVPSSAARRRPSATPTSTQQGKLTNKLV